MSASTGRVSIESGERPSGRADAGVGVWRGVAMAVSRFGILAHSRDVELLC